MCIIRICILSDEILVVAGHFIIKPDADYKRYVSPGKYVL